jgi:hypothetical protein
MELTDAGFDAGAQTISFHLAQRHGAVPSGPSIWRVSRHIVSNVLTHHKVSEGQVT